jgi:hypothetical protein
LDRLNSRKLTIIIFLLSITVLSITIHKVDGKELKIMVVDSGKLYSYSIDAGSRIILHYIHSIYRVDIYEVFEVSPDSELILREVRIGDSSNIMVGARDLEDFYMNAEPAIIHDLNIRLKRLNIRIGEIGKPTITFNNNKISLYDIAGFGSLVTIMVDN